MPRQARDLLCARRMYAHLTFRALDLPVAITEHPVASWLWTRLQRCFPDALAAALMTNHGHLLTPIDDATEARKLVAAVLSGLRRSCNPGARIEWAPNSVTLVPDDPPKLARQVRYIALNPTRAGLVDDPLRWPWSTHRDTVGAVASPWVTPRRLARALSRPESSLSRWLHAYVSADPSVHVDGTPLPRAQPTAAISFASLGAVLGAAVAATRASVDDVRSPGPTRRLFLQLARDQGHGPIPLLAEICAIARRTVYENLEHGARPELSAGRMCLGDERLRAYLDPTIHAYFARIVRNRAA